MKKPLLIALLMLVAVASCQKKKSTEVVHIVDSTYVIDTTSYPDTSYYIAGLTAQTAASISKLKVDINVLQKNITDQKVTLSLGELPKNAKGYFTAASGYPGFNTNLVLDMRFTPVGVYPITVITTTEDKKSKKYTFDLNVNPVEKNNCLSIFYSGFTSEDYKIKDAPPGNHNDLYPRAHWTGSELFLNRVFLYYESSATDDFYMSSGSKDHPSSPTAHVRLDFNCENGDVTIAEQEIWGMNQSTYKFAAFTISGSGHADLFAGTYTITYKTKFVDNGVEKTANITISGKFKY